MSAKNRTGLNDGPTPLEAQIERFNNILRKMQSELRYVDDPELARLPSLIDADGDVVVALDRNVLNAWDKLPDESVWDLAAHLVAVKREARDSGYRYGMMVGRRAVIDSAHELLGVDAIVAAIDRLSGKRE